MTRIDFHTLSDPAPEALMRSACRVIEQAYLDGRRVHVHAGSEQAAQELDEWLWRHEPASFVPHNLVGEGPNPPPPVQIGWNEDGVRHLDLLVSLAEQVPTALFGRFNQVIEFVPADEAGKQLARERYRFYRERGYALQVLTPSPAESSQ